MTSVAHVLRSSFPFAALSEHRTQAATAGSIIAVSKASRLWSNWPGTREFDKEMKMKAVELQSFSTDALRVVERPRPWRAHVSWVATIGGAIR